MPMIREVDARFFSKWSREMAYVLGFFVADGNMIRNRRGAHFISFHITDRELLVGIQKLMKSNHKIGVRDRGNKKWKLGYRLQIGSLDMYKDLLKLGMVANKSKIIKMPPVPKQFLSDFIRGYFDGDGCIYFKRLKVKDRKNLKWIFTSRFTSGSNIFLTQLLNILRTLGISKGFIYAKTGGFELVLSHKDSLALFNLMYNNSPCILLDRKYKLFKKAINTLYPEVDAAVAQR